MTKRLEIDELGFIKDPESFMLFTGAGLSADSGLPLWRDIKDWLLRHLFFYLQSVDERELAFQKTYTTLVPQDKAGSTNYLQPEYVTLAFTRHFGRTEHQTIFRDLLDCEPSDTYLWLSKLLASSAVKNYATVNVDELLEKALLVLELREGFEWKVCCGDDARLTQKRFILHKLHGTLSRYDTWCITMDRLEKLEPNKKSLLTNQLKGLEYILFYGYSGRDEDIENFFEEWLSCTISTLKEVWFCTGHSWKNKPRVAQAFEDAGVTVQHRIAPEKNKTFFESWSKKVGIKDLSAFESSSVGEKRKVFSNFCSLQKPSMVFSSKINILQNYFSDYDAVVSAPAPFILAGDYGIYMNGLELFLLLPIRSWVGIRHSKQQEFVVYINPALNDVYGADYLSSISSRFGEVLQKVMANLAAFQPFSVHLGELGNLSVKLYTEIPPRAGLEDNLTALLLSTVEVLWNAEIAGRNKPLPQLISDILPTVFEAEYKRRPETGYLHLLPALVNVQLPVQRRIAISDRSKQLPSIQKGLDNFEKKNAAFNIQLNELVSNCRSVDLEQSTHRISLAVLPRAPLPGSPSVSTRDAVRQLLRKEEANDFKGLKALALLTDSIGTLVESGVNWSRIGPLLNSYQCLLHSIERSSCSANTVLGRLIQEPFVTGCKCTGAGPGGAMLIVSETLQGHRRDPIKSALQDVGAELYLDHIEQYDVENFAPIRIDKVPMK